MLAIVSGMLARYLAEAGVDAARLPRDPVALVPVSVRKDTGDAPAEGNEISIVFVDLPVGEPDLAAAHRADQRADDRDQGLGEGAGRRADGRRRRLRAAADGVGLARAASWRPVTGDRSPFNVVVSNVPGPQFPLYLNGSQVRAAVPGRPAEPGRPGPERRRPLLRRPVRLRHHRRPRAATRRSRG